MIIGVLAIQDFILISICFGLLIFIFWSYVKNYSNNLTIRNNNLLIENYFKFNKKFEIDKNDILGIEINIQIKGQRKYNIKFRTKKGIEKIFYFQRIDRKDVKEMKNALQHAIYFMAVLVTIF